MSVTTTASGPLVTFTIDEDVVSVTGIDGPNPITTRAARKLVEPVLVGSSLSLPGKSAVALPEERIPSCGNYGEDHGQTCHPDPAHLPLHNGKVIGRASDVVVVGLSWTDTGDASWFDPVCGNDGRPSGFSRSLGKSGDGHLAFARVNAGQVRYTDVDLDLGYLSDLGLNQVDAFDRIHGLSHDNDGNKIVYFRLGCGVR
jgi:hypothetical protein